MSDDAEAETLVEAEDTAAKSLGYAALGYAAAVLADRVADFNVT